MCERTSCVGRLGEGFLRYTLLLLADGFLHGFTSLSLSQIFTSLLRDTLSSPLACVPLSYVPLVSSPRAIEFAPLPR